MKLIELNASFMGFYFFRNNVHPVSSR
jgi:hypothetical protein